MFKLTFWYSTASLLIFFTTATTLQSCKKVGGELCGSSGSCTNDSAVRQGINKESCQGNDCNDDQTVDTPVMISGAFLTANCQEEPLAQNSSESTIACRLENPQNPGKKAEADSNLTTDFAIYDAFNRPMNLTKTAAPDGSPWQWYFSVPKEQAVGTQAKLAIAEKSSNKATYKLATVTPDKSRPASDFNFINEVNVGLVPSEKSFHLGNMQPFTVGSIQECTDSEFSSLKYKSFINGIEIKIPITVLKPATVVGIVLEGVCGSGSFNNKMIIEGVSGAEFYVPLNGSRALFDGQTLNPGTYIFKIMSASLADNNFDDFIVTYIKFKSSSAIRVLTANITITPPPVQQTASNPEPVVSPSSSPASSPVVLSPAEIAERDRLQQAAAAEATSSATGTTAPAGGTSP